MTIIQIPHYLLYIHNMVAEIKFLNSNSYSCVTGLLAFGGSRGHEGGRGHSRSGGYAALKKDLEQLRDDNQKGTAKQHE